MVFIHIYYFHLKLIGYLLVIFPMKYQLKLYLYLTHIHEYVNIFELPMI